MKSLSRSLEAASTTGRSRANDRRSPLTEYLPRRKRHVPAGLVAALPDSEADELQTVQSALAEMQFRVGDRAGQVATVVGVELDHHEAVVSGRNGEQIGDGERLRDRDERRVGLRLVVEADRQMVTPAAPFARLTI